MARALLKEAVSSEDEIMPTMAFAAQAGELGPLAYGASPEGVDEAFKRTYASTGIRPLRVMGGGLLLRQEPVTVELQRYGGTGPVARVTIRVFSGSNHADEVADRYEQALRAADAPFVGCRNLKVTSQALRGAYLAMAVEPDESLHSGLVSHLLDNPGSRLPAFPPPTYVEGVYKLARGAIYGGKGWGFSPSLPKRGSKTNARKLILACVAAHVHSTTLVERNGAEKADDERAVTRARIAQLLNRHVLGPAGKPVSVLPEGSSDELENILKAASGVYQNALQIQNLIFEATSVGSSQNT